MRFPAMFFLISVCSLALSAADDLQPLSDEFSNPKTLSDWQRLKDVEGWPNDQLESIAIEDGKLVLVPRTSAWYQDMRGVLVHRQVSGDVVVHARIATTARNGKGPPRRPFSLCGIFLRSPRAIQPNTWRPGGENYIFLSHGSADKPGNWQWEVKTTQNSKSDLRTSAAPGPEVELAVIRQGAHFALLARPLNGEWTVHQRYHRADMPENLQVGITVYTDWPNVKKAGVRGNNTQELQGQPDLRAAVDFIRFKRLPENIDMRSDTALVALLAE